MQKQEVSYNDGKINYREQVVLIDTDDCPVGVMEKLEAHRKGLLHRAFSIFILNDRNELLLQRRAMSKYHGAGLWTNTCCSHPQPDELVLEAAYDRLNYEMGIQMELSFAFKFLYQGEVENNLIEHELDHVFVGFGHPEPQINPDEVMDFQWVGLKDLQGAINVFPEKYTIWFRKCLPMLIDFLQR